MPRNSEDLARRAAQRLGVLAAGQSLEADDREAIEAEIDGMLLNLQSRGVFNLADPDQIPDDAFVPLADYLATIVAADFGVTAEALASRGVSEAGAEKKLRQIKAQGPLDIAQRAEYF